MDTFTKGFFDEILAEQPPLGRRCAQDGILQPLRAFKGESPICRACARALVRKKAKAKAARKRWERRNPNALKTFKPSHLPGLGMNPPRNRPRWNIR